MACSQGYTVILGLDGVRVVVSRVAPRIGLLYPLTLTLTLMLLYPLTLTLTLMLLFPLTLTLTLMLLYPLP